MPVEVDNGASKPRCWIKAGAYTINYAVISFIKTFADAHELCTLLDWVLFFFLEEWGRP